MLPRARRLQTAVWEALGLNNKNRALGLIFITIVATIWVVASFVVQDIEGLGVHPLILTYIANSLFAVFLPIHWIGVKVATAQREEEEERTQHARPEQPSAAAFELIASHHADRTRLQLVWSAAIVAPLWFLAQLTFNMSLQLTSVTSNTILSSTSALTTYIFSVLLLSERFTVWKMMFIIVLISGTAAVTLADSRESTPGSHEAVGDIFCMLSAVIYGLYTVALRWLLVDDKTTKMMLFFGYMGALIFCILGPMLLLAWWIGFDLGSLSLHALGLVVAKGVLDNVLSDYLWARAILLIGRVLSFCREKGTVAVCRICGY
jgi:solute carrier family 35 protein F5